MSFLLIILVLFGLNQPITISAESTEVSPENPPLPIKSPGPPPPPLPGKSCNKVLAPGSSQIVDQTWEESPTEMDRKYRVRRDKKDTKLYNIDLNIKFSTLKSSIKETYGNGPVVPSDVMLSDSSLNRGHAVRNDEQRAAMIYKTKSCFNKMKGKLTAKNGVKINLNWVTGKQAIGVPEVPVSINTKEHRSHSNSWESDIDCPTIIHEALHKVGLCDGYHEHTPPSVTEREKHSGEDQLDKRYSSNKYDCRSIEPDNSVMNNQHHAIGDNYDIVLCPPNKKGQQAGFQVKHLPKKCPDGSPTLNEYQNIHKHTFHAWVKEQSSEFSYIYKPSSRKHHALKPAQVRMITQPACVNFFSKYVKCSKNAYRTHSIEGCAEKPDYCKNGGHLR